jgi:hypothetical protein
MNRFMQPAPRHALPYFMAFTRFYTASATSRHSSTAVNLRDSGRSDDRLTDPGSREVALLPLVASTQLDLGR